MSLKLKTNFNWMSLLLSERQGTPWISCKFKTRPTVFHTERFPDLSHEPSHRQATVLTSPWSHIVSRQPPLCELILAYLTINSSLLIQTESTLTTACSLHILFQWCTQTDTQSHKHTQDNDRNSVFKTKVNNAYIGKKKLTRSLSHTSD